jgi:hypothetical protein
LAVIVLLFLRVIKKLLKRGETNENKDNRIM